MEINYGIIRISTTFHQITIMATDPFNNLIAWNSADFNSKMGAITSYEASKTIANNLKELGIDNVDIVVSGTGFRGPAIKAFMDAGININMIKDVTPIPHNGVRPQKRSRKRIIKTSSI